MSSYDYKSKLSEYILFFENRDKEIASFICSKIREMLDNKLSSISLDINFPDNAQWNEITQYVEDETGISIDWSDTNKGTITFDRDDEIFLISFI